MEERATTIQMTPFQAGAIGAHDGALAWINGLIPFGNPIPDDWFYDPCDSSLKTSEAMGEVSQLAWMAALGLKAGKFRGPEWGKWKDAGQWQEGLHFHLDWGKGLGSHHLPQQSLRFWRNLRDVFGRWWE